VNLHHKRDWELQENEVTPEHVYFNRRSFLRLLGVGGLSVAAASGGLAITRAFAASDAQLQATIDATKKEPIAGLFPAQRNSDYPAGRALSDELVAASTNNYYEFTTEKDKVWQLARSFEPWPWQIRVEGHAAKTGVFDLRDLLKKVELEQRIYRFRCVEAWAMTVPWTGVPLRSFLDLFEPTAKARFVRFISFNRP
jgi:sulfoxide reductase catalytic subunit YedY